MNINYLPKKLLVLGDVMLDYYTIGEVKRISPEAPVPVVLVKEEKTTLGGAANVANNLAGLKNEVSIFGALGKDAYGEIFNQILKQKGIKNQCLKLKDYSTIFKNRIIAQRQQIARIDYESPFIDHALALAHFENIFQNNCFDMLILSDYGKGLCSLYFCQHIIKQAKNKHIKTIIDPKVKDWKQYAGCFLITPNFKEFKEVLGLNHLENTDENIEKYAFQLRSTFNLENIIITRSDKGMSLVEEKEITHFRVQATEVFDVSGAGDTVVAVLATCLSNNYSLKEACSHANLAAGYVISKTGTYSISLEELSRL